MPSAVAAFKRFAERVSIPTRAAQPLENIFDRSELKKMTRGKFVFLGESNHYTQQKLEYRLQFLKYLVKQGFTYIGDETGRAVGRQVDLYIQTGNTQILIDMGMLVRSKGKFIPKDNRTAENILFMNELRKLNRSRPKGSPPIHYFGFDLDMYPGRGFQEIAEILSEYEGSSLLQHLQQRLKVAERLRDRPSQIKALYDIVRWYTENDRELESVLGSDATSDVYHSILTLTQSIDYLRGEGGLSQADRERAMMRQMDEIIAKAGPKAKFVLMGHNVHLAKRSHRIAMLAFTDHVQDYEQGPQPPHEHLALGSYLFGKYDRKIYSVWMLLGGGTSWFRDKVTTIDRPEHSIEAVLAEIGKRLFVPLGRAPASLAGPPAGIGLEFGSHLNGDFEARVTRITDQTDAIYFVQEASPAGHH